MRKPVQNVQAYETAANINVVEDLTADSPKLYSLLDMTKVAKLIAELQCKRCGHRWFPRSTQKPKNCASRQCNSPYWDRPRRKKAA